MFEGGQMDAITGVHHLSLTVRDLPASVDWYMALFGLQKMMDEEHDGGRAVVLCDPGMRLFVGLHAHDANDGTPFDEARTGLDHISFAVPDRDALVAWKDRLATRNVPWSPISDQPWGSVLVFRDPDGIQLELCAPPTTT